MPGVVLNKFNAFVQNIASGAVNLGADTLKIMFTNTAPLATQSLYGDVSGTEIPAGGGYSTGGLTLLQSSATQVNGLFRLIVGTLVLFPVGNVSQFRWLILYSLNTSVANRPLIAWWDYGSFVGLSAGQTFTIASDQTAGILEIQ